MNPKKSKPNPDDKEQSARFIETAEQVDNPDAKDAFEEAMQKIVKKKQIAMENKPKAPPENALINDS